MNLVAGGAGQATAPAIVGAAAQAYPFDPLTTATMALALCGGLLVMRVLRRRSEARDAGTSTAADRVDFRAPASTTPTEPPVQR